MHITSSFPYLFITTVSAIEDAHIHIYAVSSLHFLFLCRRLVSLERNVLDVDLSISVLVELSFYWMMHIILLCLAVLRKSKAQTPNVEAAISAELHGKHQPVWSETAPDGTSKTVSQ